MIEHMYNPCSDRFRPRLVWGGGHTDMSPPTIPVEDGSEQCTGRHGNLGWSG